MTIVIQHNKAMGTTKSRKNCDENGNDYYFNASRKGLVLNIGYFSSLYAPFRVLILAFKTIMGQELCYGNVLYFKL